MSNKRRLGRFLLEDLLWLLIFAYFICGVTATEVFAFMQRILSPPRDD